MVYKPTNITGSSPYGGYIELVMFWRPTSQFTDFGHPSHRVLCSDGSVDLSFPGATRLQVVLQDVEKDVPRNHVHVHVSCA